MASHPIQPLDPPLSSNSNNINDRSGSSYCSSSSSNSSSSDSSSSNIRRGFTPLGVGCILKRYTASNSEFKSRQGYILADALSFAISK